MPDLSSYSPDKGFVPHLYSQVNLSDVFIPSVGLPEVNAPSGVNSGEDYWSLLLKSTGRNPFSHLGIIPAAPAAVDDYWSNRKFTSEADSYQSGSTYKDIGFLIGRDNEDLFSRNRSWWDESFNTVARLLDKAGGYTVQGFGFLGGLMGIGNHNDRYESNGFANWIAGAADNGLAVWAKDFNENVDNYYRPIYNEASDREKGFWKRMLTDGEFWKGETVDMVGFLASAYATGGIGEFLNLGGKAVRGLAALKSLNFADPAVALSEEGLSGLSEATNLNKGAAISETGAPLVTNTFSPNAGKFYSRFVQEAGNFANANKINMGVGTIINSASEAMFEASNLKDELSTRLASERNGDGTYKYTPEQVKNLSASAAQNSFLLNMMVLPLSNLWEMNMFFGKAAALSGRNAESSLVRREAGLLANAEIAKRTFGQKGLDYLKHSATGIFAEGLWEENIQLAIERINNDPENLNEGFLSNIGRVLNQYANQTGSALVGNDSEAAMNIGLGGLVGGIMGVKDRFESIKNVKKDIANYNASINSFKIQANDLYEKDANGGVRLDDNGQPVISPIKTMSFIASMNKTLNMTELADNLKQKNMPYLHSIVDNENISRLVKAYADSGMIDSLIQRLDDAKGMKPEDLMLLGLNPNKTENVARLEYLKAKTVEYKKIYDNIEKNFFVTIKNDEDGTKTRAMKDKLFYLSTRASNLNDLKSRAVSESESKSTEIATTYKSDSDSFVDKLNDLYGTYNAAKKRVDYLSLEQRSIEDKRRMLEEPDTETIQVKEGVTITKKKKKKTPPVEQFTGVDEQTLSDAVNDMNSAEKALGDYVQENKDSIKNIKKNADGSFRYEIPEKNRLMYDTGAVQDKNVSKDLEQAYNATLNVFNRLSDIKYGERYYDNVYGAKYKQFQNDVVNDNSDQIDENLNDEPTSPQPPSPANSNQKLLTGPESVSQTKAEQEGKPTFRSREEWDDSVDELNKLKREREILEGKPDLSLEEETHLEDVNKRIDDLENAFVDVEKTITDYTVSGADNIPQEKKKEYTDILNEIAKNKRRVVKRDGYYEVDGQRYGKVSDLIGNVVPEHLRAGLSNALNAGYTVDSIVKAYFDNGVNDDFKKEVVTKISEDAYNRLIQQLDVISKKLRDEGIDIIANNVVVFDSNLRVAGEIDLLGVDKKGNFKIYEIEARQGRVWAQIATKTGRGPAIYEMSQKQLSAYRNLFANLYGSIPSSISVLFPVDVKYNKDDPSGFIEKVKLKSEIRYTPTANVQIKSNIFQPVKVGSKYDSIDLTSLYTNSFLPQAMDVAKEKFRFLLRNMSFDGIKKDITINVKEAEAKFQELYTKQQNIIEGQSVDGYKINPLPDTPNLYALKGNKEISIVYNGQILGFMQPMPTLAYKNAEGKFVVLDENTDLETYKTVTGNSEQTYNEFTNIARAYKKAYQDLTSTLTSGETTTFDNKAVQDMFEIKMSYGELDKVKVGQSRPSLGDLVINGVKIGSKSVITVLHVDANDSVKVIMDKNTRTKTTGKKLFDVDNWATNNFDKVKSAITTPAGERVTDYAAIIETPDGNYHVVSLREKVGAKVDPTEDYIKDLGDKFTASVSKNVFKNENINLIPKKSSVEVTIKLKGDNIISSIYSTEDVNELEKFGLGVTEANAALPTDVVVNDFVKGLGDLDYKKINSMFAVYELTSQELINEIMDDFNAGNWSSMDEYLEQLKCDL